MIANRSPLRELMNQRGALVELALVAVLIGLGVNLVASGIPGKLRLTFGWTLLLGIGLVAVGFGYLLYRLSTQGRRVEVFEGLFVVDEKTRMPIRVRRYDLSERLCDFLDSAFSENEALKAQWEGDALGGQRRNGASRSGQLLTEALEYYLLREFSIHVSDFFNLRGYDRNRLANFEREDIPDVLLRNRFLELFSKKMEDRPAFNERSPISAEESRSTNTQVKVVLAYAPDRHAVYDHFDLVLPRNSKVCRVHNSGILIDAPRMRVHIRSVFDGFCTNLPDDFEHLYLKCSNPRSIRVLTMRAQLVFEVKPLSVFSPGRFDDYAWVDSFCEHLHSNFSCDSFFDRIQWEAALTVARVLKDG